MKHLQAQVHRAGLEKRNHQDVGDPLSKRCRFAFHIRDEAERSLSPAPGQRVPIWKQSAIRASSAERGLAGLVVAASGNLPRVLVID